MFGMAGFEDDFASVCVFPILASVHQRPSPIDSFGSRELDIIAGGSSQTERPWLGVRFGCTGAYLRVYRARDGISYHARCPRCGRAVTFKVGEGGTSHRFFEVRCG
jgi:hypothetical protein